MKIAISSCLVGNAVRYDGQHKRSIWLERLINEGYELVAICPEVEIGLPVPRPPIQLVQNGTDIKVKVVDDHSKEFTQELSTLAIAKQGILSECAGYICTEKSPSCGYKTTAVFDQKKNKIAANGTGVFITKVAEKFPGMPIINHCDLVTEEDFANFLRAVKLADKLIS